jgi:hypothetical protein
VNKKKKNIHYIHIHIFTCISVYTYISVCIRMYTYVYVCVYVYIKNSNHTVFAHRAEILKISFPSKYIHSLFRPLHVSLSELCLLHLSLHLPLNISQSSPTLFKSLSHWVSFTILSHDISFYSIIKYIYIYTYRHVYTFIYRYAYTFIYIYIYIYMYVLHICIFIYNINILVVIRNSLVHI